MCYSALTNTSEVGTKSVTMNQFTSLHTCTQTLRVLPEICIWNFPHVNDQTLAELCII